MCDCDAPGGENMNYIASTEILPNHTLPNLDQIYAISEVINNINKKHTLFQRLINISHLLFIGVIVAEKFCLRKCVCLKFASLSCTENKED